MKALAWLSRTLVPDWKRVLKHAWSVRLNILLALASAVDSAITYAVDGRLSASLIVAVVSLVASGLRIVKQSSVSGGEE
jgi:hypothetical protein